MKPRTQLGEFEQLVMLAILHSGNRAYGYEIVKTIERKCGRAISRSSLYITFDRLEGKGFLESRLADPDPVRGGRPKRYVSVTSIGLRCLQESRQTLLDMWQGLESRLEDGS